MPRVTQVAPHLSAEEVQQKVQTAPSAWLRRRWLVIYTLLLEPRASSDVATQLGVSRPFVKKMVAVYKRSGASGLESVGSGGRYNAYVTPDAEKTFLAPFLAQAARGEVVTTKEIHAAFEAHVGEKVDDSTLYRLLHRHQWRKVVPRAIHPHAEPIEQEAFKKTSVRLLNKPLQPKHQLISDQI